MTLVQRMDELIHKLESNDKTYIENLNKKFEEYCEKQKPSKKRR